MGLGSYLPRAPSHSEMCYGLGYAHPKTNTGNQLGAKLLEAVRWQPEATGEETGHCGEMVF